MRPIKLLEDIPVEEKHGLTKGRVFCTYRYAENEGRGTRGVWVTGDAGEEVKILNREYDYIEENQS